MKKVLRFFLILIVLLIATVVLIPILFKDQIFDLVKEKSKDAIKGELVIGDLELSLLSDFPNLTLSIEDVKVIGEAPFEGIELASWKKLNVEIDLFSAFSGNEFEIKSILLKDANVHVIVLEDGTANYDIAKESEEVSEDAPADESGEFKLSLNKLAVSGFNLNYEDRQGNMYAVVNNLNHVLRGDFSQDEVGISTETEVEELNFKMDGISYLRNIAVEGDMDLDYVFSSGKLTLQKNTWKFNDLAATLEGNLVNGESAMDMDLKLTTPQTDFKSVLSLIPEFYMTDFKDLKTSGSFVLNAFVKGQMKEESESLPAFGLKLQVADASIQYPDLPASINKIHVDMEVGKPQGVIDKTVVDIRKFAFNAANQPVDGSLYMTHPTSDPNIRFKAKGRFDLGKIEQYFPVDDLKYNGLIAGNVKVEGKLSDFENARVEKVVAEGGVMAKGLSFESSAFGLPVDIDTAAMAWSPQNVTVPLLQMRLGKSDLAGSGTLDNLMSFILNDETLEGRFNISSQLLDLNEMASAAGASGETETEVDSSSSMEVVRIPQNLDMLLNAQMNKVLYANYDISNAKGSIVLKNGVAKMQDVEMETMGGMITMSGSYNSVPEHPAVDFDFGLNKLDIGKAVSTIDMIKNYAPVLESAIGKLNTNFSFKSILNDEMMPDLATVAASGLLKTENVSVEPESMQKVASLLNNPQYGKLQLGNSNVSFAIADGKLSVQPFEVKIGDQKATIKGNSGLDQSIDYVMTTSLPISKIEVPAEIKALGLGGNVDVDITFTGTMTNPKIGTNFKSVTGQAQTIIQNLINQKVDEAKQEVVNKVNDEAKKLVEQASKEGDRLVAEAEAQAAKIKAEAKKQADNIRAEAKKQADKLLAEAKGNPLKEMGAKAAADKLNSEADKKATQLEKEAAKKADDLVLKAKQQKAKLIEEAEAKAKL